MNHAIHFNKKVIYHICECCWAGNPKCMKSICTLSAERNEKSNISLHEEKYENLESKIIRVLFEKMRASSWNG